LEQYIDIHSPGVREMKKGKIQRLGTKKISFKSIKMRRKNLEDMKIRIE